MEEVEESPPATMLPESMGITGVEVKREKKNVAVGVAKVGVTEGVKVEVGGLSAVAVCV